MMAPPLVSVIIPTYNYGRFVTEAVDSALKQDYPHLEILVVDDGSTDATRSVLEPYRERIKYLFQHNQGLSAARNTGIRSAKGEYIALLDADDAWHPRKLGLQVQYLGDHPEISLLATERFFDHEQCWPGVVADPSGVVAEELVLDDVIYRCCFAPSSVLIRRSCLDDVGLFDPLLRCVEDRDMWIRLASRHRLAKLPLPLLWYRSHPDSLSSKAAAMEQHELRVLNKAFSEVAALRGRWLFRRRVFSYASFVSALEFRSGRQWRPAIGRVLRSLVLWPLPYRRDDAGIALVRLRVLVNLLLRSVGLRAPHSTSKTGEGPAAPLDLKVPQVTSSSCLAGTEGLQAHPPAQQPLAGIHVDSSVC